MRKRLRGKPPIPSPRLKSSFWNAAFWIWHGIAAVEKRVRDRNARAAVRAAQAADPPPADVIKYMYTDTSVDKVPPSLPNVEVLEPLPPIKRVNGEITYRDAIKEAVIEEMLRDSRVIFYGEDVAEYGGAFKLSKGLLEMFGRARVFNTPISEAASAARRWARRWSGCGRWWN